MTQQKPNMPHNRKGLAHIIDAAQFSAGGFARLWRETAFRLELLAGALCLIGLVWLGATLFQLVAFGVLALVLLAVEALNTAIEEIVDHVSPQWSEMGKYAKDCGSAAVALLLVAMALLLGAIAYANLWGSA
jgi:diacylglycerol kinase (ATP)